MIFRLQRRWLEGDALIGELYLEGIYECLTLERRTAIIPAGTYPVTLTTSERARKGTLWTPRKDHALPLIEEVPGRTGIRIHAGNAPEETDGCVLVGAVKGTVPGKIFGSRAALAAVVAKIGSAPGKVTLVVEDAA